MSEHTQPEPHRPAAASGPKLTWGADGWPQEWADHDIYALLGAKGVGKTVILAGMEKNIHAVFAPAGECVWLETSPYCGAQADRVRLWHAPPQHSASYQVEPEYVRFRRGTRKAVLVGLAGEDLLSRGGIDRERTLRLLRRCVVVVVINPLQRRSVARFSFYAHAYWRQEELGEPAAVALAESARLHWGINFDDLTRLGIGYSDEVKRLLQAVRLGFSPTRLTPWERYPLLGDVPPDQLDRARAVLDRLIDTQTAIPDRVFDHLKSVLPELDHVILTFTHKDVEQYLPGVSIDWLALAREQTPPRRDVLLTTGAYLKMALVRQDVHHQYRDDFDAEGPACLWAAMKSVAADRTAPPRRVPTVALVLALVMLAAGLTLSAWFGWLDHVVWGIGWLAVVLFVAFVVVELFQRLIPHRKPRIALPAPAVPPVQVRALPTAVAEVNGVAHVGTGAP